MTATATAIELSPVVHKDFSTPEIGLAQALYEVQPGHSVAATPLSPSIRLSPSPPPQHEDREVDALPPADKGRKAWLFLLGATVIETTVWGLLNAVGILQNYWMTVMFKDQPSTVTLAASLMNGLSFMSVGVFGPIFAAWPHCTMYLQLVGLVVSSLGFIATAFTTNANQLIGTMGILYPFSAALYLPCATLIYEWFQARRGLATGIMFAGTGVGGTVFPFIIDGLLRRFGYKATMISMGIAFFIINGASLMFIRRRIPLTGSFGARPKVQWKFLRTWAFWCGIIVLLFTSLGNFNPTLWIPTFADNLGIKNPDGVALVSIMNAASVPGNALIGYLSDRVPVNIMCFVTCFVGTLAVLLAWGFGVTAAPLVVFALVWGSSAICFVSLWSKLITRICKDDPTLSVLMFSMFAVLRGVGNVTSGPVSTKLLETGSFRGAQGAWGKTNYGAVFIYTALTTFLGGVFGAFFPS